LKVEDDILREWRRKAADIVIAASVLLNLPLLIVFSLAYGPAYTWPVRVAAIASYLILLAVALLRRISYQTRVWALLGSIYLAASIGILAVPQGPYVRVLPIVAPILAIGLIGVRAARIAILVSAIVMIPVPLLSSLAGVARVFVSDLGRVNVPPGFVLVQGAALIAQMIIVMILLERFYGFLLQALAAQRQAAAEQGAANLKLEREIEERRRLEREVARIGDDERRRVGNEVHDGVCQQLTGALLRCQALELRLGQGMPLSSVELEALSSLLGQTINEAHAVAQGLCPLEPTPEALGQALRRLVKRTRTASGVRCEFLVAGDVRVPDPTTAHHLYRITQEALSNAVRHARADRIAVELRGSEDRLILRVEDNGVGLQNNRASGGMGLRTMACRAQMLEGEFTIGPAPDGGTCMMCRVPRSKGTCGDGRLQPAAGESKI
jgi:signal transduction histidine kinase